MFFFFFFSSRLFQPILLIAFKAITPLRSCRQTISLLIALKLGKIDFLQQISSERNKGEAKDVFGNPNRDEQLNGKVDLMQESI